MDIILPFEYPEVVWLSYYESVEWIKPKDKYYLILPLDSSKYPPLLIDVLFVFYNFEVI